MGFRGILKKQCTYRGVEQLAARWAHNPKVGSSSLPPATISEVFALRDVPKNPSKQFIYKAFTRNSRSLFILFKIFRS